MKHAWNPWAAAADLLGLVGARLGLDTEWKDVGDESTRTVAGRFVRLSGGRTRCELRGPVSGQAVVFVHGFTSPAYVWGELPGRLQEQGYRTLVYDLFGRGLSDRPDVVYDRDLYDRQLLDLLGRLRLGGTVHLVGLSMGAIIATEFTLRHRERVASLTLIDPAGFSVELPGPSSLLTVAWLGDCAMHAFGGPFLVSGNAKAVHDKSLVPELQAKFRPQLAYLGYKRAILSSARSMPLADFSSGYRKLAGYRLPVEVFWGKQDEITPVAGATLAGKILPKAKFTLIEGAGHLSHYEKPDVVTPVLLDFLRRAAVREKRGKAFVVASSARSEAKPARRGAPKR